MTGDLKPHVGAHWVLLLALCAELRRSDPAAALRVAATCREVPEDADPEVAAQIAKLVYVLELPDA